MRKNEFAPLIIEILDESFAREENWSSVEYMYSYIQF